MRFSILFTVFLLFSKLSRAQEVTTRSGRSLSPKPTRFNLTVTGRIRDTQTGENLPFAAIGVRGTNRQTQTNVDGYFTLLTVPSDTVTLTISYLGYTNRDYRLEPREAVKELLIDLTPTIAQLDEVSVTGQRTEVMKAGDGIGLIKLTPRNLTKLPNIGERDIFRALQLMPGVSAANESSAGLYVRGGTPDQTLVLFDGFTVYNVEHLYGFFSAFNYNALKDVQLYKGGFDARYGGRLSAVAELTGKEGSRKQFNVGGDASFLSVNAFVESPIGKKLTVLVAGRRSFQGPLYNKLFEQFQTGNDNRPAQNAPAGTGRRGANQQQTTQQVSSYFYDLNGRLTFRPTDRDQVTLSLYNGQDNLDNSQDVSITFGRGMQGGTSANTGNLVNTDLSNWGNTGSSLKWSRRWNDRLYVNSLVSYSSYFNQRDLSNSVTITRANNPPNNLRFGTFEDNKLIDWSIKTDAEWKLSANQQIDFGVQLTHNKIDYAYSSNDTISLLSKNDRGTLAAFYAQDQIRLLDNRLLIKPGVRLTYYTTTKQVYAEPRLSATYQLTDRLTLKGAWGRYYQFVKQVMREDISQGSRNFWLLSDGGTLPVGAATHFVGGLTYETAGYLFDVEAYAKNLIGITEYTLRFAPQVGQGLVPQETFFNGTGSVRGIDFLVQKKIGNYAGWVGYTYAMAQNRIAAFSDGPFFANQDVRHEGKLINTYRIKRFDLGLTFVYAAGKPYTSVVGEYSIQLLDGTSRTFTNPSGKNANRFPDYSRLDASVTYYFKHGSIGASVFNAYNRTNVWYKRFTSVSDGQESQLVVTDVTYLGITPNLTLSYRIH